MQKSVTRQGNELETIRRGFLPFGSVDKTNIFELIHLSTRDAQEIRSPTLDLLLSLGAAGGWAHDTLDTQLINSKGGARPLILFWEDSSREFAPPHQKLFDNDHLLLLVLARLLGSFFWSFTYRQVRSGSRLLPTPCNH